jgi:hypothetical protein
VIMSHFSKVKMSLHKDGKDDKGEGEDEYQRSRAVRSYEEAG